MSSSDLFFPAESDEEEDEFQFVPAGPSSQSSPKRTSRSNPTKESLFIPEEDDVVAVTGSRPSSQPSSSKRKEMEPASSPPDSGVRPGFVRGYLGEFVCEGWSLSKGKGYCSPGSKIVFERPNQKQNYTKSKDDDGHQKIGPARLVNGKMVHAKSKIGGKQMSLKSMMAKKPPPAVRARAADND